MKRHTVVKVGDSLTCTRCGVHFYQPWWSEPQKKETFVLIEKCKGAKLTWVSKNGSTISNSPKGTPAQDKVRRRKEDD